MEFALLFHCRSLRPPVFYHRVTLSFEHHNLISQNCLGCGDQYSAVNWSQSGLFIGKMSLAKDKSRRPVTESQTNHTMIPCIFVSICNHFNLPNSPRCHGLIKPLLQKKPHKHLLTSGFFLQCEKAQSIFTRGSNDSAFWWKQWKLNNYVLSCKNWGNMTKCVNIYTVFLHLADSLVDSYITSWNKSH